MYLLLQCLPKKRSQPDGGGLLKCSAENLFRRDPDATYDLIHFANTMKNVFGGFLLLGTQFAQCVLTACDDFGFGAFDASIALPQLEANECLQFIGEFF